MKSVRLCDGFEAWYKKRADRSSELGRVGCKKVELIVIAGHSAIGYNLN